MFLPHKHTHIQRVGRDEKTFSDGICLLPLLWCMCVSKHTETYILNMCRVLYINYTSIKLFFFNATCASCLNAGLNSCLKRADWRFNHMKKQTLFLLNCAICGYILADAVVVFYV